MSGRHFALMRQTVDAAEMFYALERRRIETEYEAQLARERGQVARPVKKSYESRLREKLSKRSR